LVRLARRYRILGELNKLRVFQVTKRTEGHLGVGRIVLIKKGRERGEVPNDRKGGGYGM